MARSLEAILQELDAGYNPSRQMINQKLAALPAQADAQIQGLQATQTQAFDNILAGARDRGLGFAGIPLAEQAKYSATEFTPAVARVRQSQNDVSGSLMEALNATNLDQRKTAMALQQSELDRDEAARQAAASRAAAAGPDWGSILGGGELPAVAAPVNNPRSATAVQRADKGYNFTAANGRPISAAQYAQLKGIGFRDLLGQMAKAGDNGAKQALQVVGNDFGYDSRKVGNNKQLVNILNSLLYGVNKAKTAPAPEPAKAGVPWKPAVTALNINNPLALRR